MTKPSATVLATPSAAPLVAPRNAWSARVPPTLSDSAPVAPVGTTPETPPTTPETTPLIAESLILPQSIPSRLPCSIWRPWMAASRPTDMATSMATLFRIEMMSCRKIICTVSLVAAWATGMPALAVPKVTNAAAIIAAI
ncbi:hypothetical protein [Actinoalloteichus hymeniacidonis]|uniref:hypothetical protein n=1 Tax=Actinoalloteichus hymeniacidonis TaxID=340345 RepID=UPI0012F9C7BA|nr:hypothetical protein [Actinoalloteichus hymeniacidonis]MBB5910291.1 hypothetical protein [Actinoalloteichus hymeniacidonis]